MASMRLQGKQAQIVSQTLWGSQRYIIVRGGTRAGKTYAILQALAIWVLQEDIRISVVSMSYPHLRMGAMRDFQDILNRYLGDFSFTHNRTTSTFFSPTTKGFIEFFSVDQAAKVRGAQRDVLFINEANKIDKESFYELDVRTRRRVIFDFNPDHKFWLNDFWDTHPEPHQFWEITLTYKDNPYLDQSQKAAIEARANDPKWWQVMGLGEYGTYTGRAWHNYEVCEALPKGAVLRAVGIDPGFTQSPTAIVEVYTLGDWYYVREALYDNIPLDALAAFLQRYRGTKATVIVDAAQKEIIYRLRRFHDIPAYPCRKTELSAAYAWLNTQPIRIVKPSPHLLAEAFSLRWEGDRLIGEDHALDAMRYALDFTHLPTILSPQT